MDADLIHLVQVNEHISHFFFPALNHNVKKKSSTSNFGGGGGGSGKTSQQKTINGNPRVPLRIIDTILYTYGKPTAWYFFDEGSGLVKKRGRKEINSQVIVESFVEQSTSETGVKAWFVEPDESFPSSNFPAVHPQYWKQGGSKNNLSNSSQHLNEEGNNMPEVEHHHHYSSLSRNTATASQSTSSITTAYIESPPYRITTQSSTGPKSLLQFLQKPKVKGMFQQFVDNKLESDGSLRNVVVLCQYTPATFSVHKLISKTLISDKNIPLERRFAVSETDGTYFTHPIMSPGVAQRFLNVCESVATHFAENFDYRVVSMSLWCRIGRQDEIYILWCSALKLTCLHKYPNMLFYLTTDGTTRIPYEIQALNDNGGGASPNKQHFSQQRQGERDEGGDNGINPFLEASIRLEEKNCNCPLCHCTAAKKSMPRVRKRWLLFALSLLDRSVEGWEDAIPPSVCMIHPEMTFEEFQVIKHNLPYSSSYYYSTSSSANLLRATSNSPSKSNLGTNSASVDCTSSAGGQKPIVAGAQVHEESGKRSPRNSRKYQWLGEAIRICETCLEQCIHATQLLSQQKVPAPKWLAIDDEMRVTKKKTNASPIIPMWMMQQLSTLEGGGGVSKRKKLHPEDAVAPESSFVTRTGGGNSVHHKKLSCTSSNASSMANPPSASPPFEWVPFQNPLRSSKKLLRFTVVEKDIFADDEDDEEGENNQQGDSYAEGIGRDRRMSTHRTNTFGNLTYVRIVAARKDEKESADVYENNGAKWVKIGFGKPQVMGKFSVLSIPMDAKKLDLSEEGQKSEGTKRFLAGLANLEKRIEKERMPKENADDGETDWTLPVPHQTPR